MAEDMLTETRERIIKIEGDVAHIKEQLPSLNRKISNGITARLDSVAREVGDMNLRLSLVEVWRASVVRIHWVLFGAMVAALGTAIANLVLFFLTHGK